jgi:hypothetical protein
MGWTRTIPAVAGRTSVRQSFRNVLLNSIEATQNLLQTNGHTLAVWSRKDALIRSVTDAQVDDAFDVQRRRGEKAITRTTRDLT